MEPEKPAFSPKKADQIVREYYREKRGWHSLNIFGKLLSLVGLVSIIFTGATLRLLLTPTHWEFSFQKILTTALEQEEKNGRVDLTEIYEKEEPPFSKSELREMLIKASEEGVIEKELNLNGGHTHETITRHHNGRPSRYWT